MADLDSNIWYNIIYTGANYALGQGGSSPEAVHVYPINFTDTTQQWQILQLNSTQFRAIRSRSLGPGYYLEAFPCATNCLTDEYCSLEGSGSPNNLTSSQEWQFVTNGDGTIKLYNGNNSMQANLDAFDDFYVGLRSNLSSPVMAWMFSGVSPINDETFSTIAPSAVSSF